MLEIIFKFQFLPLEGTSVLFSRLQYFLCAQASKNLLPVIKTKQMYLKDKSRL